ncbi:Zn-dependent hydrolase [Mesorhizobium sp. M7A.F.Ca.US.006.01.1.1]|uniref:hydantoinase/carbamoylase family amidase n=1 Tax=Mesorhizobium sp. M7A.F.Ca.US.006.01.1.1 TaxID=2496707 RepID=UPI000FCA3CAB|nr:hydantoinase/carbamoylase family amidase [Mesorhizobium sp. M7A.F.Ca.US.006.01.1.1]RUZ72653.1 Zn-dependent hydrolase [Mesorhizobium sp. M7A.F.Ca.US.006.01.1.1]
MSSSPSISQALETGITFAEPLFELIGRRSFDGVGFTRAAYGKGEQMAHEVVAKAAAELGLEVTHDAALNMTMVLKGQNSALPPLVIGSHLDAVPQGGNFDGLAGVLAGLACVATLIKSGRIPSRDIHVMAIRSEESAWFGAQHVGSRAMLGTLPAEILSEARRVDTYRTLAEHMEEAGVDISKIAFGTPLRDPQTIAGYVEVHIEQGPVLVRRKHPLGVAVGIRGNRRCRRAICHGAYGHSGTLPRALRNDAVFAVAELVCAMDRLWRDIEEDEGGDLVVTFGKFVTDYQRHSVTTVPGQVEFSFDARSLSAETLDRVERTLMDTANRISKERGVRFEFSTLTGDVPVDMNDSFCRQLIKGAHELCIPAESIMSGAGHDAGDFAESGVPSALIFVRNDKGSHNPEEAMEIADWAESVRLLVWFVSHFEEIASHAE